MKKIVLNLFKNILVLSFGIVVLLVNSVSFWVVY